MHATARSNASNAKSPSAPRKCPSRGDVRGRECHVAFHNNEVRRPPDKPRVAVVVRPRDWQLCLGARRRTARRFDEVANRRKQRAGFATKVAKLKWPLLRRSTRSIRRPENTHASGGKTWRARSETPRG